MRAASLVQASCALAVAVHAKTAPWGPVWGQSGLRSPKEGCSNDGCPRDGRPFRASFSKKSAETAIFAH